MEEISSFKDALNHAFSMTNLGLLNQFWGLEISQLDIGIKVHYSKYASDLLKKIKMKYCKPRNTPFLLGVKLEEAKSTPLENNTMYRQLVGCLPYLTRNQLDISYEMSVAYRHIHQPHYIHWREGKRIMHFVQGTKTHGIHYVAKYDLDLVGFTDFDWDGDNIDRE